MASKQMMDYVENVTSNPMISQIRVKSGLGVRKAYQNISGKRCTKQGFKYLDNS
jgi:histone acetyltransferase (RNA polymerase elongator complex component)